MPDERYSLEAVDYHKGVTARPVRADDVRLGCGESRL
jgi:hypothetical protein